MTPVTAALSALCIIFCLPLSNRRVHVEAFLGRLSLLTKQHLAFHQRQAKITKISFSRSIKIDQLMPLFLSSSDENYDNDDDDGARSAFGTRQYWDNMYSGMGDFPADEYSWYYGWEILKSHWTSIVPSKQASILLPGIGNDPILLDLYSAGYKQLTAFDYSDHAVERQEDLLSYEPGALDSVKIHQADARHLDAGWTDSFDVVLEKGTFDAIYLSGDGNLEKAVEEIERVLTPNGILISVSSVVPEEFRRELFKDWEWLRDGSDDLNAGCFILKQVSKAS